VDHKRNENAVAGVKRLTFPVINKSVSAKAKEKNSGYSMFMVALLNSNSSSSKCNNKKALKQQR